MQNMKYISIAKNNPNVFKSGLYKYVIVDSQNKIQFNKWSNKIESLQKELNFIKKVSPSLYERLIIVETIVKKYYE